jgi:hypothetical protein
MENTFLTPEVVANEALMCLQSNLVMADLVHRDYADEFVSVGDTISIRKPAKFVAKNFTGVTEPQDIAEDKVTVKLDRFRDVTVAVTSKEMTLDIADFSAQVVQPAMQAIAQAIDEDLLAVATEKAGYRMASDPCPGDLYDIANVAKQLDLAKAPIQNRSLVLHPEHKYRYALTQNLSMASYAGDNETLRESLLGKVYSLDTYMDQNAPNTLAATPGTANSYTITGNKGDYEVDIVDSDGEIAAGDGFILDGYLYRFVTGGVGRLKLNQPLMVDADEPEIIVIKAPHSVAFHRNAIALVSRNLALPMGAANAAYASAGGLGVRVVYDYDSATKTDKISFDVIYGIKELEPSLICALDG